MILSTFTAYKKAKIPTLIARLGQPSEKRSYNVRDHRSLLSSFLCCLGLEYQQCGMDLLSGAYHTAGTDWSGVRAYIRLLEPAMTDEDLESIICELATRLSAALNAPIPIPAAIEPVTVTEPVIQTVAPYAAPVITHSDDKLKKAAEAIAALLGSPQKAELDESRVVQLIKQHSVATEIKLVTSTGSTVIPTGLHHKILPDVLLTLKAGINVYLVGPAGSGKTTLAIQLAKALEVPFHFNGALDSEYKLTGFVDANGKYVRTSFREAYEHGGLYLFDEIDASAASALLAFNAALENGHSDFPDGCIKMHKDFYCIAAANTYGTGADRVYIGRNQLDGAFLDRFAFIEMDYDEKLERTVAGNDDWVDYVQSIRKAVKTHKIRHVVSPRASIKGAALLAAGQHRDKVENMLIWKGLDKDTIIKLKTAA